MAGYMRPYFKGENEGLRHNHEQVGWALGWYQPEFSEDAAVAYRRQEAQIVEYWATVRRNAETNRDFELAKFASTQSKLHQKNVRILTDLLGSQAPAAPFVGSLTRPIWPVSDMLELAHWSAVCRKAFSSTKSGASA